jgi:hypothetical protein
VTGEESAVDIGGRPLTTGVAVLADRDEIRVEGVGRMFFSTEVLASVEPFPGSERTLFCPRCTLELVTGEPAVRCPQCRVWHHQRMDRECWTHTEACAMCSRPTALDQGFRWIPEES